MAELAQATNAEPHKPRSAAYIPTLDGWRAIAILFVLMNHDAIHHIGSWSTAGLQQYGRKGVELFFALSGILICTRLLEEEKITGTLNLKNFYIRRVFRIQPAALTYLLALALLMATGVIHRAFHGVIYGATFLRNYLPLSRDVNDWYTSHFWSLSLEEHFYIFLPAFLLLVRKWRVRLLVLSICLLKAWQIVAFRHTWRIATFGWSVYNRTDFAANGILLAVVVALLVFRPGVRDWCRTWLHPWIAVILTAAVWYLADTLHVRMAVDTVLCTYPLLIVATMLHPSDWIGRFLEWAPIRFVGRLSYSIYLWQMLFYVSLDPIPLPHSAWLLRMQYTWLRYPITLLAALASYYFVEKPMIKLGHRLAKSPVPGRGERDILPASSSMRVIAIPNPDRA